MDTIKTQYGLYGVIFLVIGLLFFSQLLFKVPTLFPAGTSFTIYENETLSTISERLEKENIIVSALLFRASVSFQGKDKQVQLGVYEWNKPLHLLDVINKITKEGPNQPLIRVTIPEGSTVDDIVMIVQKALPALDGQILRQVIEKEKLYGKLFPSTYFLLPSVSEEKLITTLSSTFKEKYQSHFAFLPKPPLLQTEESILSLAAILEGEAKTQEDMKIISGILQKRLSIKMPLQVDVAKETYKQRGLPITPINNPGITAIDAVFNPTETPYLYYITGKDGTMYYAKTFTEHKKNINKYLR